MSPSDPAHSSDRARPPHDGGTPASDGMVIAAVLEGQREQFELLVDRYQAALTRTAESRLGRRDWAEDVVQETFLCAFRWLGTYDSRYSFRTWLWTILLNQCNRHYRRGARRPSEVAWDAPEVRLDAADVASADDERPLARLLAEERQERLRGLLGRLPDGQADALRLRFFGELKFQEIADAMGCSLSTAKNRVRWGLARLSEMLEESSSGERQPSSAAAARAGSSAGPRRLGRRNG